MHKVRWLKFLSKKEHVQFKGTIESFRFVKITEQTFQELYCTKLDFVKITVENIQYAQRKWTNTVINSVYRATDVLSHGSNDVQSRWYIELICRYLWAIEQMVNRANGTRANGHRANGNRANVVPPSKDYIEDRRFNSSQKSSYFDSLRSS